MRTGATRRARTQVLSPRSVSSHHVAPLAPWPSQAQFPSTWTLLPRFPDSSCPQQFGIGAEVQGPGLTHRTPPVSRCVLTAGRAQLWASLKSPYDSQSWVSKWAGDSCDPGNRTQRRRWGPRTWGGGEKSRGTPKPLFRVLSLTQKRLRDTFPLGSEMWGGLMGVCVWGGFICLNSGDFERCWHRE